MRKMILSVVLSIGLFILSVAPAFAESIGPNP
jgi:hypothetical protein